MAVLNFPINPYDGQLYPDPAIPGSQQYVWNSSKQTWLTVFQGISSIRVTSPLYTSGDSQTLVIGIPPASASDDGYMTAADKRKLDSLGPIPGTVTKVSAGIGIGMSGAGESITTSGVINLLPSSSSSLGGVKAGSNVSVDPTGILTVKTASTITIGAVKSGPDVSVLNDGSMVLAPASTFTVIDSIQSQFNGTAVQFSLKTQGIPFSPVSPSGLLIFIEGVFKVPFIDYTVSQTLITFTEAPTASQSFYGLSLT